MRQFRRRQNQEKMVFVMVASWNMYTFEVASCREKLLWSKTRTRHWWDAIVNRCLLLRNGWKTSEYQKVHLGRPNTCKSI